MNIEIVQVTPKQARNWLTKNTKNRALRNSHVDNLATSFKRGEYVMTHQGIAFAKDGEILDGQHRLSAIAQCPEGMVFQMLVSHDWDRDACFGVVDTVQCKRNVGDVLGIDPRCGEAGTFLAKIHLGRSSGITPTYVKPFVDFIEKDFVSLLSFAPTSTKTWASAPVRAAAIISMKTKNADYVKSVYRALTLADFDNMPKVAQAAFRAHMSGSVRAANAYDIYCRCLKVFDSKCANLGKVQIKSQADVILASREYLQREIFDTKKNVTHLLKFA